MNHTNLKLESSSSYKFVYTLLLDDIDEEYRKSIDVLDEQSLYDLFMYHIEHTNCYRIKEFEGLLNISVHLSAQYYFLFTQELLES